MFQAIWQILSLTGASNILNHLTISSGLWWFKLTYWTCKHLILQCIGWHTQKIKGGYGSTTGDWQGLEIRIPMKLCFNSFIQAWYSTEISLIRICAVCLSSLQWTMLYCSSQMYQFTRQVYAYCYNWSLNKFAISHCPTALGTVTWILQNQIQCTVSLTTVYAKSIKCQTHSLNLFKTQRWNEYFWQMFARFGGNCAQSKFITHLHYLKQKKKQKKQYAFHYDMLNTIHVEYRITTLYLEQQVVWVHILVEFDNEKMIPATAQINRTTFN